MLSITLWLLTLLVPLQIFLGDVHGLNTLHHQPAKLAAIEAHWNREAHAPLTLFAIPDQKAETNHFAIEVPLLGSLILTHDINGVVPGLKDFAREDRAPAHYSLFRLPHHGGGGPDRCWRWWRWACGCGCAAGFMITGWFLQVLTWSAPSRLHRRAGGLDHHGSRTPALDGLWRDAHRPFGDAVADRLGRVVVTAGLYGGLSDHVSGRAVVHRAHRARRRHVGEATPVEAGRPSAPVKPVPGAAP